MKVYISALTIEGAALEGENPLPVFRSRNHHKEVVENGTFTEEQKKYLGYEAGNRYLPYRIQDRYSRDRKTMVLKTIILENDLLEAVFLPEYGGRLYSLKDKRTDRDILYKNPVFQPGNLAILNAWFSGGIEWNIGQLGHTFTTCSPVHAAKLCDDAGNEFLRIFEYERCKSIFWHIDFHLPKGSDTLLVYVRIVNDNPHPVPMYWWTNIAADETSKARVFSCASEVIYIDHRIKGFGIGEMPYLPSVPGVDVSYPLNFPFSNEYFFQTPQHCRSPWEAVAYEDGRLFYERSTALLRYRKMFCWGSHRGGRRWCDFLSKPGQGNYIELQGGFAPTQLHGIDMPADSVWDFTQILGISQIDTALSHQESWDNAGTYINDHIDCRLKENEVYEIHDKLRAMSQKKYDDILSIGSGWGALERLRRKKPGDREIPRGFYFSEMSIGKEQYPWLSLLQEGSLPECDVSEIPVSWMVQDEWLQLLDESLKKNPENWYALMHYGVMLFEKGEEDKAIEAWESSLKAKPSPWVYRNLAGAMKLKGKNDIALTCMEKAYMLAGGFPDKALAEEYLDLLIQNKEYQKAWKVYESLPAHFSKSDRIQMIVASAALELGKEEFVVNLFNKEFAVLREGEMSNVNLWYRYNAKKVAKERGVELTDELVKEVMQKLPPPENIDFRVM